MVVILCVLIITTLITFQMIKKDREINSIIIKIIKNIARIVTLLIVIFGTYHLIINGSKLNINEILIKAISILLAMIFTILCTNLIQRIEKEEFYESNNKKDEVE